MAQFALQCNIAMVNVHTYVGFSREEWVINNKELCAGGGLKVCFYGVLRFNWDMMSFSKALSLNRSITNTVLLGQKRILK